MLAIIHHRAHAYEALHAIRTRLMGLKQTRCGLFIKKGGNPFSCPSIVALLAEIAALKLAELRMMLSADLFEKKLRAYHHHKKQQRIWLGSSKEPEPEMIPPPKRRMNMALIVTLLLWHSRHKPRL
ncbi:MAG: hypothetical protein EB059_04280 [Alphaproteobacteria bacterium]|nr:hypothetical protein [Alphaproteobacteria bacterium]